MDVEIVRKMAKNWGAKFDGSIIHCPATARFVTGVPSTDAMFYHFETDGGTIVPRQRWYVDGNRFWFQELDDLLMFKLRWGV